ncbi:hypothetical protein EZV62_018043 [Acer yangbiense]|uniref:Retrovirus-related Pol polyprotein from transposon TNT 1-94 n=1 Tax=Acer yangbiense TaxID=1000413 RepID=A0A5C7HI72_9ROSI|nr:hypothetical protein EZV62_018043 [Acer yangbiense]
MTKSLSSRLYLKGRFFYFKMQDGKNLQHHIDEFNKLCLDLENIQVEYEDKDKALVLLHSLPKSYENFIDILKHDRKTLSLEDVIGALNSKYFQRKCEMKEQGESLTVKGRTNKRDQKSIGKSRSKPRGGYKKSIIVKFSKLVNRTKEALSYIHFDLWGPSRMETLGGDNISQKLDDGVEIEVEFANKQGTDSLQPATDQVDDALDSEEAYEDHSDLMNYQSVRELVRREHMAPSRYGYADLISFALLVIEEIE